MSAHQDQEMVYPLADAVPYMLLSHAAWQRIWLLVTSLSDIDGAQDLTEKAHAALLRDAPVSWVGYWRKISRRRTQKRACLLTNTRQHRLS